MTSQEQLDVIRTTEWYNATSAKGGQILAAMESAGFQIEGWVITEVEGVEVRIQMSASSANSDTNVEAGRTDDDKPLYSWRAPLAWFVSV